MTIFLIAIAIALRIFGSFHDALSARKVRWLQWHFVNWLRRDLIIAAIAWHIHGAPWGSIDAALWWLTWIGCNIGAHKFFYWAGNEISLRKNHY
jgi:hypothetical protein